VNVTASRAHGALCYSIPLIEVKEIEGRSGELNFPLPEDVVSKDSAPKLDALNLDWASLWIEIVEHVYRSPHCLT
jgi:hypothetical protein